MYSDKDLWFLTLYRMYVCVVSIRPQTITVYSTVLLYRITVLYPGTVYTEYSIMPSQTYKTLKWSGYFRVLYQNMSKRKKASAATVAASPAASPKRKKRGEAEEDAAGAAASGGERLCERQRL